MPRHAGEEVRPAVPATGGYAPEQIAGAEDGAAAAHIVLVLGQVEIAVRSPGHAVGVSESPGDQLGLAAGEGNAHDRAAARHLPADDLPRLRGLAEGDEGAGDGLIVRVVRQQVGRGVVDPAQDDVLAGNVVELGIPGHPAEIEVVLADHAGVGGGAHPEVQPAVGADDGAPGEVVPQGGKALDEGADLARHRDAQDLPRHPMPAGDVEGAAMVLQAEPRRARPGAGVGSAGLVQSLLIPSGLMGGVADSRSG
jgi:hypothetical protein